MSADLLENLDFQTIILVIASLGSIFIILFFLLWIGWKKEGIRGNVCPYCGQPMRLGIDIARPVVSMVDAFFEELPRADNPKIDFTKAAFCPLTGRIFPHCVTPMEQVTVSWNFLKERCPGTFVSWGSLSEEEQGVLKLLHDSLEGFQTEKSSFRSRPEAVEEEFSLLSPGPLYVDRKEKIIVGWKKVPGTYFEVLVVQRPRFQSLEDTL